MKTMSRLSTGLRLTAAAALIATLGTWFATGRHLGWTQTSTIVLRHDAITGIDYPVRRPAFVAGVEVLAAGTVAAAALAGLAVFFQRRGTSAA